MKRKIDSAARRVIYSMRLVIGEPQFAHNRSTLGLNRFILRFKKKVNAQWNLFCIIYNLKKVHAYGVVSCRMSGKELKNQDINGN